MNLAEKIKALQNYFSIKDYDTVISSSKIILKKFPDNSFVHNICGLALQAKGDPIGSINYFEKSIFYDQNNFVAMNNLATSFKKITEFGRAENLYKKIMKINPKYIPAIHNYANLKKHHMMYTEAIDLYNQALKEEPNNNVIRYNLATTLQGLGSYEDAKKEILKILKINPKFIIAHKVLSELTDYSSKDSHILDMEKLVNNNDVNDIQKIELYFALGKAYEDINEYSKSFEYLKKGNKIKKESLNYNVQSELNVLSNIIDVFKEIDFNKKLSNYTSFKKIIFICGMPRSGTTLVEQIISSHKNVCGAGELIYLSQSIQRSLFDKDLKLDKEKIIKNLEITPNNIEGFYNQQLDYHKSSLEYVTDKAPQNFKWIGIMKLFFPNCKVVHCVRNPKDNCLSLYKNNFPSNTMNWSFDEEDIGQYYSGYKNLMNFWKIKMPDFIYDLNYESLVKNQKKEIKNLINFCELNWDSNCLEFYKKNKTPIKTVSINQARKPIYNKSINSSQHYSKHLPTLFSFLEKLY
ncbi:sulfotransferase [Candidatus Pelagibacter sp.]|nr:sulfotransferase [Candidatus Pelagibacter sp.]